MAIRTCLHAYRRNAAIRRAFLFEVAYGVGLGRIKGGFRRVSGREDEAEKEGEERKKQESEKKVLTLLDNKIISRAVV